MRGRLLLVTLAVSVGLTGCSDLSPGDRTSSPTASQPSGGPSEPGPTSDTGPDPSPDPRDSTGPADGEPRPPRIRQVPQRQWQQMIDAGMVRPECPVQSRTDLRRVDLDFIDFQGRNRRGHLIVREDTAQSVERIFTRLYDQRFPIRRMVGVERFDGDLNASLRANNTSAFNCRRADQISAPFAESPHANGRAVDINPVQNPWIDVRCECWSPGPRFAERTPGPGKILQGDPVWTAFDDEGWIWQNIDVADYMHFDTGYPSAPYRG